MPDSSAVEQVTVNHLVAGSNPARAAIFQINFNKQIFENFPAPEVRQENSQKFRLKKNLFSLSQTQVLSIFEVAIYLFPLSS